MPAIQSPSLCEESGRRLIWHNFCSAQWRLSLLCCFCVSKKWVWLNILKGLGIRVILRRSKEWIAELCTILCVCVCAHPHHPLPVGIFYHPINKDRAHVHFDMVLQASGLLTWLNMLSPCVGVVYCRRLLTSASPTKWHTVLQYARIHCTLLL